MNIYGLHDCKWLVLVDQSTVYFRRLVDLRVIWV